MACDRFSSRSITTVSPCLARKGERLALFGQPLRNQYINLRALVPIIPAPERNVPSYLQGAVLAFLVIANTIAVSVQVPWAELQKRAGCLAVTHLIPLYSGFSFSLPAHMYHIKQGTFQWVHRWLDRLCVVHCLLHGSILGTVARNTRLGAPLIIPLVVREQGQSIASLVYPQDAGLEK